MNTARKAQQTIVGGSVMDLMAQRMRQAGLASATPVPKDGFYPKTLRGIFELYEDRLGYPDENIKERLTHYYDEFERRGHPAFERLQEAICIASSKVKAEQRTIAYVIGILKQWLEHGYGNTVNEEARKIFAHFEKKFSVELSEAAKHKFLSIISNYGMVDTLTAIFTAEFEDVDMSLVYVNMLEQSMEKGDSAE